MQALEKSTVIVCGIVRNAEKGLKRNIPVIDALCDRAKDYKIVVYENDSKDRTKSILREWSMRRGTEKIHVLLNDNVKPCETVPSFGTVACNPFYSGKRIEKMASLRNRYLTYVREMNWKADYVIVVDLDVSALFLNAILSSFSLNVRWDAVTAYGYSFSPFLKKRYHDTYALVESGRETEPHTEKKISDLAAKYGKLKYGDAPVRVFSAFGGLAIYRYEAIKDVRYQLIYNDDKFVEVYCEHYGIYRQMKKLGYDKVFINPSMYLKYQTITVKLVFNALKKYILYNLKNRIKHLLIATRK